MKTAERIPPLLSPYISLPPATSLALVTSTVSTTANWVLLRYLHAALSRHAQAPNLGLTASGSEDEVEGVVLVSWMRDLAFWEAEARRAVVSRLNMVGHVGG